MNIIDSIKDKRKRHKERYSELNYQYVFSDSIHLVNQEHWQNVAQNHSIFMSLGYLQSIEQCSPDNTSQRYAIAYQDGRPKVLVSVQIAEATGDRLTQTENSVKRKMADSIHERILVCGNLVSSGLHGVAYDTQMSMEEVWRVVAEILYKIRRKEKLGGDINFAMIKDIKGSKLEASMVLERYSYRKIQTDPDMVLSLDDKMQSFEDYLASLNTKYRSRIRKVIKTLEQGGYCSERLIVDDNIDKQIHQLYLNVENQSDVRLATLPRGYFKALYDNLGDDFVCLGLTKEDQLHGFISILRDGQQCVAYYVGFDYEVNKTFPLYFRLLQLVIEQAIDWQLTSVSFGRTALEPKANLGALPVETFVWARHRLSMVNFFIRKLFRNIPFEDAPERNARKKVAPQGE